MQDAAENWKGVFNMEKIDWNLVPKGTKVLVKDNCNRTWTKEKFIVFWNGFFYTELKGGRGLQRWDECKLDKNEED